MNNLTKTLINRMSKVTNTNLTERHNELLEYACSYYDEHRVGPLYQNIERTTGATKEEIDSLFPYGLISLYTWVGIPIQSTGSPCKPMAAVNVENFREVYFDHNATTFVREEVKSCLVKYYQGVYGFGNPSSSTNVGRNAYNIIHTAHVRIADLLNVGVEDIIFTGCGSEADNMAIKGVAFNHLEDKGHIITSKVEHPAVIESLRYLEKLGFDVTYLDVDCDGRVLPQSVKECLRKDTILVSIMAVNNEIGMINPIKEIGALCREAKVPFMVDAIQGFGKIKLRPKEWGISLLSMSGHKIYAPKGVGALYVEKGLQLVPLVHGGSQEFGKRAGTENVGSIMAFGLAAELAQKEMESEANRLAELRNIFLDELRRIEPLAIINGSLEDRIPNNINVGFPDIDSGSLLLSLNLIGVYVSAGSACSAGSSDASHVIKALGVDTDRYGIIRFSFGLPNTIEDVKYLFQYLPSILKQLRQ